MENIYEQNTPETPEFLKTGISGKLLALLQSEVFERGEGIEKVLLLATTYKRVLSLKAGSGEFERFGCFFWHLDTLIHEATNMQQNPESDLFLYLKALFDFKDSVKGVLPHLNTSAA